MTRLAPHIKDDEERVVLSDDRLALSTLLNAQ